MHPHVFPQMIGNWWLWETLGSGFSGSIFKASHIHTNQIVALKVQDVDHECPTNRYERHLYPSLQGGEGIPTLWAAGLEGRWDYLAIDLLGPSLDNLYRKSGQETMDLRSVCCIAMQVIARLEFMHSRGILHRDIQLGNCVVGLPPNENRIYMIDFGFSKRYIDPYTKRHIPDSKAKRDFIGNYWFTSIGVHCRGRVPSRRDDLEAVALMLIHLLTPRGLSWTRNGVPKTDNQHDILKREKQFARPEELCKGIPSEFEEFLRYCRRLKFQECPDYEKWKEEFRELAVERGFPDSDAFVWPPPLPLAPATRTPMQTPRRVLGAATVENVLNDLANLKLDDRPVLGDRQNIVNALRKAKDDAKATENTATSSKSKSVIVITDATEESIVVPRNVAPKAQQLRKLTAVISDATNNATLSAAVSEFVSVLLQANRSRALTKEGFAFLDALYKQLADPSVFVRPLRTSRTRTSDKEQIPVREPLYVKLGVVAKLKRDVGEAASNRALAKMIADFGAVTNKSSGRTVTKDGFAFLEGVAARLKVLQ